jgi:Domain of unknown function (DUF4340)
MKLQRTTLILLALALTLGGFVYFYEIRGANQREEVQDKKEKIFSFDVDEVQSLIVKTNSQTITLERNDKSEKPKWLMKSPEMAPANDPIVSYLMDLLVKGKSDRTISISSDQLSEFGLTRPQATIDIKLKNQKTHQIALGKPDFNRRFIYAQVDSQTQANGNINVLLVSTDFENAVNREIAEWKAVPENETKKPSSTPQPTPKN